MAPFGEVMPGKSSVSEQIIANQCLGHPQPDHLELRVLYSCNGHPASLSPLHSSSFICRQATSSQLPQCQNKNEFGSFHIAGQRPDNAIGVEGIRKDSIRFSICLGWLDQN